VEVERTSEKSQQVKRRTEEATAREVQSCSGSRRSSAGAPTSWGANPDGMACVATRWH
jgi:hypothetical protein